MDNEAWVKQDLYNLDYTIAKFVFPRLKAFIEINNGYPASVTESEWCEILDKMVQAFEILSDEKNIGLMEEEKQKVVDEGLQLFCKYFQHLWI